MKGVNLGGEYEEHQQFPFLKKKKKEEETTRETHMSICFIYSYPQNQANIKKRNLSMK